MGVSGVALFNIDPNFKGEKDLNFKGEKKDKKKLKIQDQKTIIR